MTKNIITLLLIMCLGSLCGCSEENTVNVKLEDIYIDADSPNTGVTFDNKLTFYKTNDFVKIYVFNDYSLSNSDIQYDEETDTYTCITEFKKLNTHSV